MLLRTVLTTGLAVACLSAHAAPKPTKQPGAAAAAAVGVLVAKLICEYCIEAGSVTIRRTTGKAVPLSKLDFTTQRHNGVASSAGSTALHDDFPYYIAWHADYVPTVHLYDFQGNPINVFLPGIVRVDPNATWRSLLRTSHVCLGSTFEVPTFYLVGNGYASMGMVPFAGHKSLASDFADLPKTPMQTFCEGRLVSVEDILTSYAAQQTDTAVKAFEAKTSDEALKGWVAAATDTYLRQNRAELESIAAQILGAAPLPKSPETAK